MISNPFIHRTSKRLGIKAEQFAQTFSYGIAFIFLGGISAILGPTLPGLAEQTGTGLKEISILFIARQSGAILTALFLGRLYDRHSGHLILNLALFTLAICLISTPILPNLYILAGLLFVSGMGISLLNVGGNALILSVHRIGVAPYMVALHFAYSVGAFLSPLLVAIAVATTGSFRLAYWIMGVLIFIPILLCYRVPSPKVVEDVSSDDSPVRFTGKLALFASFFFMYVSVEAGINGWIYSYGLATQIADAVSAAYLTSAFWGMETIGRFFSIPIAARFKPMHVVITGVTGATCSILLLNVFPLSTVVVWTGILLLGLSISSLFASMLAVAREKMRITGKTTGWLFTGGSMGGMILPWLVGQFFESYGPLFLFHSILVTQVLLVLVVWRIWKMPFLKEPQPQRPDIDTPT